MIYCLEDDNDIRELELYTLNSMGFNAEGFADAASFFKKLKQNIPELVVLDIMLPDMNGFDVLKRLRTAAATRNIPVIMATARSSEIEKISALDGGADDYLTKPFSMIELVARAKAILRRTQCMGSEKHEIVSLGPLIIDNTGHTVKLDGIRIDLSLKEYELLEILIKHPGRVYSRDELLNRIWGLDYDGENRTIDVHIRALRSKLGDHESLIQTVRGVGYKVDL